MARPKNYATSLIASERLDGRSKAEAFRRAGTDTAILAAHLLVMAVEYVEVGRTKRGPSTPWLAELRRVLAHG